MVKTLLEWRGLGGLRVDPAAQSNAAIRRAAQIGPFEMVRMLVHTGRVDPAAGENAPIRIAVRSGKVEIAEFLLAHTRVDPTDNDNQAIISAVNSGNYELVEMLLKWRGPGGERVDPSARNNMAVAAAAQGRYFGILGLLFSTPGVDASVGNNRILRGVTTQRGILPADITVAQLLLTRPEVWIGADFDDYVPSENKEMQTLITEAAEEQPAVRAWLKGNTAEFISKFGWVSRSVMVRIMKRIAKLS